MCRSIVIIVYSNCHENVENVENVHLKTPTVFICCYLSMPFSFRWACISFNCISTIATQSFAKPFSHHNKYIPLAIIYKYRMAVWKM